MKQHLVKHSYAAIIALLIALFALPVQAQSIAKPALKNNSGEMSIVGNKNKKASVKSSETLPLFEDFESSEIPDGWTVIDANNDGKNWMVFSNEKVAWVTPKSGKCVIGSFSDDNGNLDPDNYLISPKLSEATRLTYWFALNPKYPDDRYQVLASTTGKDISDFTIVLKDERPTGLKPIKDGSNQSEWVNRTLQLPVGTKYIAFRHFDSNKSGEEGNYILLDDITIDDKAINYDLWIAGKQVTSDNCKDLATIDGVSGVVIYSPQSNILTLENAIIDTTSPNAIDSRIDNLTINLIGTNRLVTANTSTLRITKPLTITGGGTLNVNSLSSCGILVIHTDLTITDCIVTAVGHEGITGAYDSGAKLFIRNATVTAEGGNGSISDFASLTLEGCAITQPAGAAFDPSQNAVVLDGEMVTSEVVITPQSTDYDLQICGTQVTPDNCGDLTIFDGVSGTVKYDPTNKVLTLQNATISSTTTNAIVSNIDGLTINVIGTNSLTTTDKATISFRRPLTITGGGTLNAKSGSDCAVYANETNLTINNCIVNAESRAYAIAGNDGTRETLTINNAMVTAEGKENGSICDFANVVLVGCDILQPTGAAFDADLRGIALNGAIVKSKVIIGDPSSIHTPTIDNAAKQGIYTLSGVKLNSKVEDLPKGIYIVNGKKVVK